MLHAAPPQSYPQSAGNRDQRTRNLLREVARSRSAVDGAARRHRSIVYLSTSGVYGDCGGARITESQPVSPRNARAKRRVDAERHLTRAAKRGAFRLIILRVPGIYAADRLPIERLKAGTPALRDEDDVYTNHIHADDLATICIADLARVRQRRQPQVRIYHASDDGEMKMGAWFDFVADSFGLPRPPRVARAEIANKVSPALLSFMNESRKLDNKRLKRELHVRLQFATAAAGAKAVAAGEVTAHA
jgi:nucleoside-diphosphate-sugar epimerase